MIKILKNLNKKEIGIFIICFILIFIQVWLDLKMPDYMSKITVLVQTEGSKMSDIIINGLYMLACAFGSLLSAVFTGFLASKISSNFSTALTITLSYFSIPIKLILGYLLAFSIIKLPFPIPISI